MFKIVLIILLKITMAMLPYDDYGGGYFYSSDDMTPAPMTDPRREQRQGARAPPEALLKLQGNIQKLLGGRSLPRELTDPARTPFFDVDDVGTTQANIPEVIPAPDSIGEQTYIGATRPSKHSPKNVARAVHSDRKKDELNRIEDMYRWKPDEKRSNIINGRQVGYPYDKIDEDIELARKGFAQREGEETTERSSSSSEDSSSSSEESSSTSPTMWTRATTTTTTRSTRTTTTVSTTPTPVCTDELGYRIRCTNATTPSTTTLRSRRRKTKPTKRTKKSRRTTTVTTTPTTTITTFSTTLDPNATTVNMTGLNTTTETTTTITTPTKTTTTTTETDTMETTLTTKRTRRLPWIRRSTVREPNDIDRILMILDNLTYIYETDVVDRLNDTLEHEGFPYCPTVRTRVTTTTTPKHWPITEDTGKVIAKCFVCGMDVPGIPRESQCADAFAPDHFPGASLVYAPTHVGRYKKHCKYLEMPSWHINGTEGRSMWGAWDGGCSVRWVDLSGVYTQRSCRARHQPAVGRHLVSKRLAKMEYALNMMDNGCIGSAQASLVPFSRGISLYARFYACVCTGTYCNGALRVRTTGWHAVILVLCILLLVGMLSSYTQ